jgi:hypothetical protein
MGLRPSIPPRRPFVLRTVPLLLLLICALALVACGGGGGGSSTSGRSDEEKRLAFEDCLRDEGIDVQTSPDGSRTSIRVPAPAGGKQSGARARFGLAPDDPNGPFARCRKKTGWAPSPPTAAQQARMRDQALRVARCMREHGVDMPDPSPGGGMLMRLDPNSPTFQAAARACGLGSAKGGVIAGPR